MRVGGPSSLTGPAGRDSDRERDSRVRPRAPRRCSGLGQATVVSGVGAYPSSALARVLAQARAVPLLVALGVGAPSLFFPRGH
eukprot:6118344-Alexandrium_andersonii.AAC.1